MSTIQTSLAPMLSVREGSRAVTFYREAFGATVTYMLEDPGGAVVARLSVDGAEFWVADESPENGNHSPSSLGGSTIRLVLIVADPDALFARAVAAGATEVFPVGEDHGWRLGRIADPFGHHWEIGYELSANV